MIHIGALKFIEDSYAIKGVSGTSAGAIVAALKAAGFCADDMFKPGSSLENPGKSAVFERIKKRNKDVKLPSDLIGKSGHRDLKNALKNFPLYIARRTAIRCRVVLIFLVAFWLYCLHITAGQLQEASIWQNRALPALAFLIGTIATPFAIYKFAKASIISAVDAIFFDGIGCTSRAVCEICHEIGVKLGVTNRDVIMSDFKIPIRIVAANIDSGQAKVFSDSSTPETRLFDALSASISIPVAFEPHTIDGKRYIDGGIVSNIPAFVFSEELYLYPSRRLIALKITEQTDENLDKPLDQRDWRPGEVWTLLFKNCPFAFIQKFYKAFRINMHPPFMKATERIAYTLLSGAQDLAHNGIDVTSAELPTTLRLLDFDIGYPTLKTAHQQGRLFAEKLEKSFTIEDILVGSCQAIATDIEAALDNLSIPSRRRGEKVRVAIAHRTRDGSSTIRLKYWHGFDNVTDSGITLPLHASICGQAWTERKIKLELDSKKIAESLSEFRHISNRIDKDIQWILSVPIIDKNTQETRYVINIDSNTKILDNVSKDQASLRNVLEVLRHASTTARLMGEAMLQSIDSVDRGL